MKSNYNRRKPKRERLFNSLINLMEYYRNKKELDRFKIKSKFRSLEENERIQAQPVKAVSLHSKNKYKDSVNLDLLTPKSKEYMKFIDLLEELQIKAIKKDELLVIVLTGSKRERLKFTYDLKNCYICKFIDEDLKEVQNLSFDLVSAEFAGKCNQLRNSNITYSIINEPLKKTK